MHIQYCFPTAIFSTVDVSLADQMLPVAKKLLATERLINKKFQYKTTFNPLQGVEKFKEVKPFVEFISKLGHEFMSKQGYQLEFRDFSSLMFVSEMFKGDYHTTHAHPNCVLSGVFYLQTPEGSSPIVFYDPRPFRKVIRRQITNPTDTNQDELVIHPQKGLLLMWESWLEHSVPNNFNTDDGRITLVFNLTRPVTS